MGFLYKLWKRREVSDMELLNYASSIKWEFIKAPLDAKLQVMPDKSLNLCLKPADQCQLMKKKLNDLQEQLRKLEQEIITLKTEKANLLEHQVTAQAV